mgnify:CR=1 FL=1
MLVRALILTSQYIKFNLNDRKYQAFFTGVYTGECKMKKHTDSGFTFDIREDHAIVTEFDDDIQLVEIPEQIDGVPVTELGEYLFAGKNCQIIRIPSGVKKIGRYGFYNCRNLEELWFSSDFTDLGSGAFTGCHRIRRLEVFMNSEQSGLKEILSEVGEELRVHFYGKMEAMLWFPEYYEEGVENTPARILMTEIHGSGLYYRNCFQGKVFHFLEYDKRFEMARAQESSEFLRELVYGRLHWQEGLTDDAKVQYELYLSEHMEQIASDFIRQKRGEELEWLLHTYPLKEGQKEVFSRLVNLAGSIHSPEILSMLMEYQRVYFPSKRRSFDL